MTMHEETIESFRMSTSLSWQHEHSAEAKKPKLCGPLGLMLLHIHTCISQLLKIPLRKKVVLDCFLKYGDAAVRLLCYQLNPWWPEKVWSSYGK